LSIRAQPIAGVNLPGVNVLAHSSKYDAKEPAGSACSARLEQMEVVLLPFELALGTGAGILLALPKITVAGN
jgi:hypothetical protein